MSTTYVVVAEFVLPGNIHDTEPEVEYIDSYQVRAEHKRQALAKVAETHPHLSFANVRLTVEE